jgi:hypothetical protein
MKLKIPGITRDFYFVRIEREEKFCESEGSRQKNAMEEKVGRRKKRSKKSALVEGATPPGNFKPHLLGTHQDAVGDLKLLAFQINSTFYPKIPKPLASQVPFCDFEAQLHQNPLAHIPSLIKTP